MNKYIISLVIILLCIQGFNSKGLKFSTYDKLFKDIQTQKNEIIVGVVTSSNLLCSRCDQAEEPLIKFQEKASTMLVTHIIDCEKEKNGKHWDKLETVCGEGLHLPHITFFEQKSDDKNKQWPQDHIYQGAVDTNFFLNYMQTITYNKVKLIESAREHRVFLDEKLVEFKLVYLSEDEDTPLEIKIASVQNRDTVQFGQIDSDSKLAKKYPGMKGKNKGIVFLTYNLLTKDYDQSYFEGDIQSHKEITQFIKKSINDSKVKISNIKQEAKDRLTKIREMKIQQFTKTQLDEDYFILLHLHEEGNQHPRFQEFIDEYGAFFQIYDTLLTCEKCKQHAKEQIGISKFPSLIIYPQGKKNLKDHFRINDTITFQELNETLLEYTNQTERVFVDHNLRAQTKFYNQVLNEYNKLPVVWYYDQSDVKQTLFMHTITFMKKYKKTVRFARFANAPDESFESWDSYNNNFSYNQLFAATEVKDEKVTKSIMMEESDKSFLNLILFLDNIVEQNESIRIKPKNLDDVTNSYNWEDRCRSGTTPCVIGMLSVHKKGKFEREKKQLEELKDKFPKKNVKWAYMDGYCRDEILKAAGLTTADIPTLIYYDNNKAKYKTMDKKWSETNNEQFIESLRRKNSVYKEVNNEFELGTRDCKSFNEKQTKIYEANKQKQREEAIERERQNKEIYDKLPVDYDEIENDDGLDQYGMKRDLHGHGSGYHDDDL